MSDIFISYARSTEAQAKQIAEALRALGYGVWRDDELPAHRPYAEVIQERLAAAKAVVVIWSADAVKSQWVFSEANRAREDGKLVQLSVAATRLPMPFDTIQCADLAGWTGESEHPNWRRVTASIRALVETTGGATASSPLAAAAPRVSESANAEPLLAVLAFDNLSTDPEMAYFSDGVSEEIQQTVARGADLKVIGRTSSFQYRGADKAVRRVAAELGATHVLDGAVRRSGPRVRISAQLIECAHGTTLWSDRFDGGLEDVFTLQDEIAAAVAAALKVVFAPAPTSAPVDPAAYELYLKARELYESRFMEPDSIRTAVELLERATALAPRFARAWADLALVRAYLMGVHGVGESYAAARDLVVAAAETALALDARSPAQLSIALLEPVGRFAAIEAAFDQALSHAPNDPEVIGYAGRSLASVGRIREAVALAKQAFDLDPRNLQAANTYAVVLASAGRSAESRELSDRFLALWPDALVLYFNAISDAGLTQDWDRVEALARLAREHGLGQHERIRDVVRYTRNLKTRDPDYAARFLHYARGELDRTGTVREIDVSLLCALGLADDAFDLVERSSFDYVTDASKPRAEASTAQAIVSAARSIELIRDPRYPRLCARLGLCDYWVQTDRWPDLVEDGVTPYPFKDACRLLVARS